MVGKSVFRVPVSRLKTAAVVDYFTDHPGCCRTTDNNGNIPLRRPIVPKPVKGAQKVRFVRIQPGKFINEDHLLLSLYRFFPGVWQAAEKLLPMLIELIAG